MRRLDHLPRGIHTASTGILGTLGTLALALSTTPASAAETAARVPVRDAPLVDLPSRTTSTAAAASSASGYIVQDGDTLWDIARQLGVGLAELRAANGLQESSLIHPGQVLTVPGTAPTATAAVAAPAAVPAGYEVRAGDTLWAIADAHGLSLDAVLDANGLGGDAIIYPGQVLALPAPAAAFTGVPAAARTPREAAAPEIGLDAEQVENARIIIGVGRSLGVPDRGIAIALATAMVESWIRNLDWGDRDSLGLFQQRPSTGWGTPDEVRDPARAATAFFTGVSGPDGLITRGLLDVPGWQSMDFGSAAQAVQVSAYPERYGPWESQAYAWLAALG